MSYKAAAQAMKAGLDREDAKRKAKLEADRAEWHRQAAERQAARLAAEAASTRVALCVYCKAEAPSTSFLPFWQSAESRVAGQCVCGYAEVAHTEEVRNRPHLRNTMSDGHQFTQRPVEGHDSYYCGCRGWD